MIGKGLGKSHTGVKQKKIFFKKKHESPTELNIGSKKLRLKTNKRRKKKKKRRHQREMPQTRKYYQPNFDKWKPTFQFSLLFSKHSQIRRITRWVTTTRICRLEKTKKKKKHNKHMFTFTLFR